MSLHNALAPDQNEIDLQAEFIKNIVLPEHDNQLFLSQLNSDTLSAQTQLGIYRRNYTGAIHKTLQQIYPACRRILGDEFFANLCRDYAYEYPSINQDLNTYGEHFYQLLITQINHNSNLTGFEYLTDLAELEFNWHASYYARNDTVFDHAQFSLLSKSLQSQVMLKLSHSLSLHTSLYPVTTIWDDNRDDKQASSEYTLPDSSIKYCIYRQQFTPILELITDSIALTIDAIKNNHNLGALCINHELNINDSLPFLIQKGWVSGFTIMDSQ